MAGTVFAYALAKGKAFSAVLLVKSDTQQVLEDVEGTQLILVPDHFRPSSSNRVHSMDHFLIAGFYHIRLRYDFSKPIR